MTTPISTQGLQRTQRLRKAVLLIGILAVLALAAVSRSFGDESLFHELLEVAGLALIAVCIVGRAWCSLYIGGRKTAEIVQRGPYSISRNPLYVFSFMGAFGMGALTGSLTIALLFLLISVLVFTATVKREEAWLSEAFGPDYAAYMARTPRFWPDPSKWRDQDTLEVRPIFFLRTLRDGAVMALAYPLFESLEYVQDVGWVRVILALP
ncbi:MAG: isoprenylcysteine carboxylmethyltransferase family protein [Alphaproteobacteria bacterium]|uniref:methyltransferase family protein n=1 Tax=Brevundimonas sp. TaxID=1871086 RepID=UPI0017B5061A|nr:isoprenylcysteine carboxylmethyltransferase family protein [Brevundimonas sp.]MBA3049891.1 isoprenylcysteine carboxylmethyltransferase family protein [Brevundimonas sp.]MBU3972833.1 isoprenylcysteine carboxylmethyltransferase family protein [Alphaproteobacteria bacterium]